MISVVVCVNDDCAFQEMLARSLALQSARHQLVRIENRDGRYRSAAEALNAGTKEVRGDLVMFCHQDTMFEDAEWMARAEAVVGRLPDLGIAGVAGARPVGDSPANELLSNITDSVPPQRLGHRWIENSEPVQTVDECLFFVPRAIAVETPFDVVACPGWHLYAVDFSLVQQRLGRRVYAVPLAAYHRSSGRTPGHPPTRPWGDAYYDSLERVRRKHRDVFPRIHTTCGVWDTADSAPVPQNRLIAIGRSWMNRIHRLLPGTHPQ